MKEKYHKKLYELTGEDMSIIFNKLAKDDLIFRINFSQITKHFLDYFLPIERIFSTDFKTIRNSYIDNTRHKTVSLLTVGGESIELEDNVPEGEDEFNKFIVKRYLDLENEPKDELLKAYELTINDYREIDETLIEIENKLDEITKNNNPLEIQEAKPILYFYQKHNLDAKDSILNFLKKDIKQYALSQCYGNGLQSALMFRVPYNYRWNPKMYKPRNPRILDNKFDELKIQEHRDLEVLYKENKTAFKASLVKYIKEENIVFSLTDLLDKHHLLAKRTEAINEALFVYNSSAKFIFTSAVPTIIEGIFHDLCLLAGITENDLMQSGHGFQFKLDQLNDVLGVYLSYEYYSFQFRLIRNKIAHGRLTKKDVSEMGDLMLLDLLHACKLVFNMKFELNQKLFLIDELYKTKSKPEYKYLLEFVLLNKTDIPTYYKLEEKLNEIDLLIINDDFFEFLESEIIKDIDNIKHGIFSILVILKKKFPEDPRFEKLIKKTGLKKVNKGLANEYIKNLKCYY